MAYIHCSAKMATERQFCHQKAATQVLHTTHLHGVCTPLQGHCCIYCEKRVGKSQNVQLFLFISFSKG